MRFSVFGVDAGHRERRAATHAGLARVVPFETSRLGGDLGRPVGQDGDAQRIVDHTACSPDTADARARGGHQAA